MTFREQVAEFERTGVVYESAKLSFLGVEGYDVYNCSIPFRWDGKEYIYGRVERRDEWARSRVMLFEKVVGDTWTRVVDSQMYQLEDPYIAMVHGLLVLGGTRVTYNGGQLSELCGAFFRGTDLSDLYHFTTGPDNMKDIRLVELADHRIGIFSRPRGEDIRQAYGSESVVGFAVVDTLDDVTRDAIAGAPAIPGLFQDNEWGGVNQAYLLESGLVGVIGHRSYGEALGGVDISVYVNVAFTFDPISNTAGPTKVIGTRSCYPDGPIKKPHLPKCAFTSGIVMRPSGKCDLYSGIGDTEEGRILIDYPFEAAISGT